MNLTTACIINNAMQWNIVFVSGVDIYRTANTNDFEVDSVSMVPTTAPLSIDDMNPIHGNHSILGQLSFW